MRDDRLPDGRLFEFWSDRTRYGKVYHVAQRHPKASDKNPGTKDRPFKTIGRAAEILEPGQKAIVHKGVYRERVAPARGGTSPSRMIAYEAAAGEDVIITGAEVWEAPLRPSEGYNFWRKGPNAKVWMGDLPVEKFAGYNPFSIDNMTDQLEGYFERLLPEHINRFLLRRGALFADGRPLSQVLHFDELAGSDGAFWVDGPGERIHFRMPGDADPGKARFEITAREQVFAPKIYNLGYIKVSGFRMERAADGVPVPQRSLLSATRGHHWIIERNRLRWANAGGMDIGAQSWTAGAFDEAGRHVVRGNMVADCGACGICGAGGVTGSLIEDNIIERIGALDVERISENAGLKFHEAEDVLIRRNVFRRIKGACGLWLDVLNKNCRLTGNVFADIESRVGGIYIECSHHLNLIDNNVFWDIRALPEGLWPKDRLAPGGRGLYTETSDNVVAAHNLFGKIAGNYAAAFGLLQADRIIAGRAGTGRRNRVLNNVFCECPKRILFERGEENISDGNLYDERDASASFAIKFPEPSVVQNLSGWREYFGRDKHSSQVRIEAGFDPDSLILTWKVEGEPPACRRVEAMHGKKTAPGPFDDKQWPGSLSGKTGRMKLAAGGGPFPPSAIAFGGGRCKRALPLDPHP